MSAADSKAFCGKKRYGWEEKRQSLRYFYCIVLLLNLGWEYDEGEEGESTHVEYKLLQRKQHSGINFKTFCLFRNKYVKFVGCNSFLSLHL